MPEGSEKREHKRIAKHYILRFQVRQAEEEEANLKVWEVVTVVDLSAGGALINFEKELEIGLLLDIVIIFPISHESIKCVGKVLRVQKSQRASIYRIGIVFTEISEKDKELIETLAREQ